MENEKSLEIIRNCSSIRKKRNEEQKEEEEGDFYVVYKRSIAY